MNVETHHAATIRFPLKAKELKLFSLCQASRSDKREHCYTSHRTPNQDRPEEQEDLLDDWGKQVRG